MDITNPESIEAKFTEVKTDVVINAAAYTAVDKAEGEPEKAFAVNALGAKNIAEACVKYGSRLIHISTDFVFDGTKNTPYTTEDTPNPINVYGASKLKGEQLIQAVLPNCVIVRTSWVYSTHGNNFVKTMLHLMNERDSLNVVNDQIGSPTYARGLAEWIWSVVNKPNVTGVFNWTDVGVASWYDFAVAINDLGCELGLLNKRIDILPIPSAQYPTPAKRPHYSVVDKTTAEQKLSKQCTNWRENLKNMLVASVS